MNQNRVSNNIAIAAVVILLIGFIGIVSFANVKGVESASNTDYLGSGYRFGDPEVRLWERMYLYVEGDDQFARYLELSLVETLIGEGLDLVLAEKLLDKYDGQALVVMEAERNIRYNPFTPSSEIEVMFVYFSNGNTTHLDNITRNYPIIVHGGSGVVQEGTISISDRTKGFASYRGYLDLLTSKIAASVFENLPKE